ncbi:MAG TPA: fatty acid--CoA ligase [Chloroflexia bacterium]|nr:fatty acid--CoA ligase [Chloroflexia bacterium]
MPDNLIEKTPSAYDYPLLIKHLLTAALTTHPDQEIAYRDVSSYTLRTFRERVGRLAGGLASLGVGPGDTVGVMDWDTPRYLETYFAVPMMGAVLHTLNVRLSPEQLLYTIEHAEDKVILVNKDFLPLLEGIWERLSSVEKYVLLSDDPRPAAPPHDPSPRPAVPLAGEYEALLAAAAPDYAFPDFDEYTRATTFYTTGTTGLPKGVYFSHRQIVLHTLTGLAALAAPQSAQRFHRDGVYMPLTPMFHVHAWGMPYIATMMGARQVYPGRYLPDVILGLIKTQGVTFSHCVPTILHMLLTHPASAGVDLSGWTVVIGGAAFPKGLAQAALDRGIDVFTGYGMSETCPVLTLAQLTPAMLEQSPADQVSFRTRTGRPIPLVDLRVVDAEMRDLPHDGKSTGEVVVRAPWLTQGYYKDSTHSEQLWRGGYLHTGDIGYISPDGYLQITDRLKDVIKTGGEWISSLEIEDLISQHPGVSEVAVIGMPDEKWSERAVALVVPKPGQAAELAPESILAHMRVFADQGLISRWAVPDRVYVVEAIAKTSVGKIDKKLLRSQYA